MSLTSDHQEHCKPRSVNSSESCPRSPYTHNNPQYINRAAPAPRPTMAPIWVYNPTELLAYLMPLAVSRIWACTLDSWLLAEYNVQFQDNSASTYARLLMARIWGPKPWLIDDRKGFAERLLQYVRPHVLVDHGNEILQRVVRVERLKHIPRHEAITECVFTFVFEELDRREQESQFQADGSDGQKKRKGSSMRTEIARTAKSSRQSLLKMAMTVGQGAIWSMSSETALDRFRLKSGAYLRDDHRQTKRFSKGHSGIRRDKGPQQKGSMAKAWTE